MSDDDLLEDVQGRAEEYARQRVAGASPSEAHGLDALKRALESNGLDVDEIRMIGPDPSLMYYHQDGDRASEAATIALVAAEVPQLITDVLAVTALEGPTDRLAHMRVERGWLDAHEREELDQAELASKVLETWRRYE
jgi:hypothetical protein